MIGGNATWVIVTSILLALIVYVVPIPLEWRWFRPELPTLVLLYWVLALPHRVGIVSASLVGLILDFMDGMTPGAFSVGMALSALTLLFSYQRVRLFDGFQQSIVIGLVVALALMIERWVQNLMGVGGRGLVFLYPALTSALVWVPLRNGLRGFRRHYEVS